MAGGARGRRQLYRLGIDRPAARQPYYNAMIRTLEVEHFPACGYDGLGIVPYSPRARTGGNNNPS